MERNAQLLSALIASGKPLETGLEELRQIGVTPVDAIKAIRKAKCVSLGDTKQIFSLSSAWAAEVRAADLLHDEIIRLVPKEQRR